MSDGGGTAAVGDRGMPPVVDLAIVGAGPCGLAAGIAAVRAGMSCVLFDRGPIVSGIAQYPTYMSFFSTAEKLSIGDVPFSVATEKPTRRDALAYYRTVAAHYDLPVRQYETVTRVLPVAGGAPPVTATGRAARWRVESARRGGASFVTYAHAVVVATGYFGRPNRLGVPGESLPHVTHGYVEAHGAWREPVVVVGGGNSATDAALELYRAGARVTLVHFGEALDPGVKPWVRPEIEARLRDGAIVGAFRSRVVGIADESVTVRDERDGTTREIPARLVYLMTGYLPETGLLEAMGVPIDSETGIPAHDPASMATPIPGLYLAGVIASGNRANRIFIENGRDHGDRIVAHLLRD